MQLKLTIAIILIISALSSCNNESGNAGHIFCDTACMKDSMKFIKDESKLKPFVLIKAKDCNADTLKWGRIGVRRAIEFHYRLNKDYTRCFFNDTAYAWLIF